MLPPEKEAAKKLLEEDIIIAQDKIYTLNDKLFEMWINRVYGVTDNRL